jgi:hypothetical protein
VEWGCSWALYIGPGRLDEGAGRRYSGGRRWVFNGETPSCLDAAPRRRESEAVWPRVEAEAARDGSATQGGDRALGRAGRLTG